VPPPGSAALTLELNNRNKSIGHPYLPIKPGLSHVPLKVGIRTAVRRVYLPLCVWIATSTAVANLMGSAAGIPPPFRALSGGGKPAALSVEITMVSTR
jgi:hypothetical protein